MKKTFEEALADLVSDYAEDAETDEMISAMELQIMALNEQSAE